MKVKCNVICNEFKYLDTISRVHLFNTHCLSLYGCNLWNLKNDYMTRVNVEWRKCCRRILRLSPRTHCVLIPLLMNTPPIEDIIHQRMINFFIAGLCHSNQNVKNLFRFLLLNNHSFLKSNINWILNKNKISYLSLFDGKKDQNK